MKPGASVAVLAVACGAAQSEAGIAIYSIAFGSPQGPNLATLAPGETTSVFVNIWWSPAPASGSPGSALGLSDGAFSITGFGKGSGAWSIDWNMNSPTYSLPFPWGAQMAGCMGPTLGIPSGNSVTNINWGYGFLFNSQHVEPKDPTMVWRATFKAISPGEVHFAFSGLSPTGVFIATTSIPTVASYTSTGFGAMVIIAPPPPATVPGPSAVLVLGAAALTVGRRRGSIRPSGWS